MPESRWRGAKLALLFAGGRETAAADASGHFEFSSVPDGPALLTIQHSDCRFYGEKLQAVPARSNADSAP